MALLEIRDVYAGYGETEILHGVSATVDAGEIVVVIGPNGAGKSTLAKTIIGILPPTKGSIRFRSLEITKKPPEQLAVVGLSYVPQNHNIFPSLTVQENLEMGAITRRPGRIPGMRTPGPSAPPPMDEDEFQARIDWIMSIFPNLRPRLKAPARALSGGEQQMVALARSLVLDPTLLIVDEPSAGLAPKLVDQVFQKIREINERGTAIFLVEQNAKRALAMAHRGYVLDMGRNRFEGKGEALLTNLEVGRLYLGG